MKKSIILIMFVAIMLLLVACSSTASDDSSDVAVDDVVDEVKDLTIDDEPVEPEFVPVPLSESEFASFKIDDMKFLYFDEANEYGDESALRKVPGVFMYDTHIQVWYSYVQPIQIEDAPIVLKVLGRSTTDELDRVVYSAPLVNGKETIDFVSGLKNPSENPRLEYCFGYGDFDPFVESDLVYCTPIIGVSPDNKLLTSKSTLVFNFEDFDAVDGDVLTATDTVYVENLGTTPLTVFFAVESIDGESTSISSSDFPLRLSPGVRQKVSLDASWTFDGGYAKDVEAAIFALPTDCDPASFDCASKAKVKVDIEIDYRN